jgi:phosphoribosylformylglycinamidine synthase
MRVGVVTFPGSLDDADAARAVRLAGGEAVSLWHTDADLRGVDAVVLPGALIRNDHRTFVCRDQRLRIENNRTPWTSSYAENAEVTIVLKNGEGGFVADESTLQMLEAEGRVVARYLDVNPNGSLHDIAGITNERGNVVGLMPHPEHAVEELTGAGTDGLGFFTGLTALGVIRTSA